MGIRSLRDRTALTGAFFAAAAALAAASPIATPVPAGRAAAEIEAADRIAAGPLAEFEQGGGVRRARRALEAAREARDRLEAVRMPARFEAARREELVFFNHLVPGFEAYLGDPGRAGARETLAGILARGKAHRERAREALAQLRRSSSERSRLRRSKTSRPARRSASRRRAARPRRSAGRRRSSKRRSLTRSSSKTSRTGAGGSRRDSWTRRPMPSRRCKNRRSAGAESRR